MTCVSRILVLLLVGLFVGMSAHADDRLTVAGNIDTRFYAWDNLSLFDSNYTSAVLGGGGVTGQAGDGDAMSHVITRFNFQFSIAAFENSKAVLQTHVDKEWGRAGVLFGHDLGAYGGEDGHGGDFSNTTHSAHLGAYGGAMTVEGYWLEGLIPGTGATYQLGVPYIAAESGSFGESTKLLNTAVAGATLSAALSESVSSYTWYAWLGNDFDGYANKGNGNDWAFGTRLGFSLMEGVSLDLIYAYHLTEDGVAEAGEAEENRHWIGSTLRYQMGDFTFLPSLMLYFADRNMMDNAESYLLDVRGSYTNGPMKFEGRFVYTPGAGDDTSEDYQVIGVWGIPGSVMWFNLFGNAYGQNDLGPLRLSAGSPQLNIRFESHGLMHAAAKADYSVSPETTFSAALGIFNAVEDVEGASPSGIDDATYAGGTHIATELDAWITYQFYSNASISFWAAYAMTGDALNLMEGATEHESQDVTAAGARVVYSF